MADPKNHLDFESVDFVSLVPAGDNPDAKAVLIYKAAPDSRNPSTEAQPSTVGDMTTQAASAVAAPTEGASTAPDADTMAKYVEALAKQNELLIEQNGLLVKAIEDDAYDPEDEEGGEDAEGEDGTEVAPVAKADAKADASDLDTILKANPALAQLVGGLQEQVTKLSKSASDANAIAKAEREARLEVQFAKRAQALAGLGEPEAHVAKVLRKAFDALDVDDYIEVEKLLVKAANVADSDERAMFKETGSAAGSDEPADKFSALMAKAKAPGKAEGAMSAQDIVDAVLDDHSIYAESVRTQMNGASR